MRKTHCIFLVALVMVIGLIAGFIPGDCRADGTTNVISGGTVSTTATTETFGIYIGEGAGTGSFISGNQRNTGIGTNSGQNVDGTYNTAVGTETGQYVNGGSNTALGDTSGQHVTGDNNIALGTGSGNTITGIATMGQNVAIGCSSGNTVTGVGNIVTGNSSGGTVNGTGNLVYGNASGNNVTASVPITGANIVTGNNSGNTVNGDNNIATGTSSGNSVTGEDNIATGHGAGNNITGEDNIAIGHNANNFNSTVTANNMIAIGEDSTANQNEAMAIGNHASATGANAIAIGEQSTANQTGAMAIGKGASATGANAIAIGNGASATGSIGVGTGASAANGGAAFGDGAVATAGNSVALGQNSSDGGRANTVSVGAPGSERTISNVAAGVLPTDAANVSQLSTSTSTLTDTFNRKLHHVDRDLSGGIAAAAAQMNAVPYVPGVWAVGMSGASYNGTGAVGATVSRWSCDGRWNLNTGVSYGFTDTPIFRGGVCVLLGKLPAK